MTIWSPRTSSRREGRLIHRAAVLRDDHFGLVGRLLPQQRRYFRTHLCNKHTLLLLAELIGKSFARATRPWSNTFLQVAGCLCKSYRKLR